MERSISAGDERRHRPGPEPLWSESWYFDFASADGTLGGFIRLGLYPNLGLAWYWAYLVGQDRPLVAVRDHEVDPPKSRSLEVRGEGLWSALNCEIPLDHWSIGLEAFAVAMDDPLDAYRGEVGDRIPLGFDLEWEAHMPVYPLPGVTRYVQPSDVHGVILLGAESIDFSGLGQREHSWGVEDWWTVPRCWIAGRLSDGAAVRGEVVGDRAAPLDTTGYVSQDGSLGSVESVSVDTVVGGNGLPESASLHLDQLSLVVTPLGHAPMPLEAQDGRRARLARALCRFEAGDGRAGVGWSEWLQPDAPT
jgi:hypothetical protein